MYAKVERKKDTKSRTVAISNGQKKINGKQGFRFVDNRLEDISERKLPLLINNQSDSQSIQKKENNTGLPDNLKSGIENLSDCSMYDVKVQYNADKPNHLQEYAYAQGTDIHIASEQEKYLPHEAWHLVQQKQGRVNPTTQLKDNENINDGLRLEKEADSMEHLPMQHSPFDNPAQLKSDKAKKSTIQCKGAQLLMTQLGQLLGWAMDKVGDAKSYDPHFKPLFKKINEYDRSKDGRPRAQYQAILAMLIDLNDWFKANVPLSVTDITEYLKFNEILITERNLTLDQARRLEKYSANESSPYEQMTDEGMLWSQQSFEHNTKRLGKTGKAYFEELSSMNIQSIHKEELDNRLNEQEWFTDFVKAASQELSNAVVNHYTTSTRGRAILDGGGMKSKIMLEKDLPTFKHNTSIYDDLGLGNSGFLFFFIESPNAPLRGTRFAEGDAGAEPARISIPIQESGLLTNGWIMLSDFAQREYPDIMTKKGSDVYASTLPTRKSEHAKKRPEFTERVRSFQPGLSPLGVEDMEAMMKITNSEKRQAFTAVVPQAGGDKESKQVYSGPAGELKIPDRLFNNVLVGKDIIPGLANRAGLEVARIKLVNPTLGEKLSKLRGEELMLFILKDSFRPQAMIPNSLSIKEENLQTNP